MEILKYLDVLIGLAVVMVLLSPLVSAITQFILWVFKVRPVRLRLALATLIKELNGEAFDLYDTAVVSAPAGATAIEFAQPAPLAPIQVPVIGGAATLNQNVTAMLRAKDGDLSKALQGVNAAGNLFPLPLGTLIMLQPRGTHNFTLNSNFPNAAGHVTARYSYDGPTQFASRQFTAAIAPPWGNVVAVTIDSGPFKGTVLLPNAAGVYTYPDNVRPMPIPHDLDIAITGGPRGPS